MAELNFIETSSSTIINTIMSALESGVSEPLYPGDERRIFGEVLANVIVTVFNSVNDGCRQKLLRYARNEVLDALGANRDVSRIAAKKASTTIRFKIKSVLKDNVVIPEGIRVSSDLKKYFITDYAAIIPAGETSVTVTASAEYAGVEYNSISVAAIKNIIDVSRTPMIDSAENITVTEGGTDAESDNSYRERIRQAENKLSTAGPEKAYKYWALTADMSISDVVVVSDTVTEKKTLKVYDGHAFIGGQDLLPETLRVTGGTVRNTSYNDGLLDITLDTESETVTAEIIRTMHGCVKIIPMCDGGNIPSDEILQKVYDICTADDIKPLTDYVTVEAPQTESYGIELKYYTTQQNESAVVQAVEGAGGAIEQYISWQSEQFARDINPDYLKMLCLNAGADRVDIISPVYTEIGRTTVSKFNGTKSVSHETR